MPKAKERPITKLQVITRYSELCEHYPDKSFNWLVALCASELNIDADIALDMITENIMES